jgi:hypothetical protein
MVGTWAEEIEVGLEEAEELRLGRLSARRRHLRMKGRDPPSGSPLCASLWRAELADVKPRVHDRSVGELEAGSASEGAKLEKSSDVASHASLMHLFDDGLQPVVASLLNEHCAFSSRHT